MVRLKMKPAMDMSTATVLVSIGSSGASPVCVPGSKKTPQENQRTWPAVRALEIRIHDEFGVLGTTLPEKIGVVDSSS
jgi:hypothetical protein